MTADVHRDGNNDNDNIIGEIVNIVHKESGEKIEGQFFLSVLNIFADEMTKISNSMTKMRDDLKHRMDSIANYIEKTTGE